MKQSEDSEYDYLTEHWMITQIWNIVSLVASFSRIKPVNM